MRRDAPSKNQTVTSQTLIAAKKRLRSDFRIYANLMDKVRWTST